MPETSSLAVLGISKVVAVTSFGIIIIAGPCSRCTSIYHSEDNPSLQTSLPRVLIVELPGPQIRGLPSIIPFHYV